jgi:hypothetical protein
MRFIFTITFLLFSFISNAQKLTGIWRGYFLQQGDFNLQRGEFVEEKYKYEIQINQLTNNSLEGVTYSYRTTVFYGKAAFRGIFRKETKNVLIKELKMIELKMLGDKNTACAMTCYLDYTKSDKLETLTGTFTSLNVTDKTNCGDGTVYLEKVVNSDFKKEGFLLKKGKNNINSEFLIKKSPFLPNKKDSVIAIKKKGTSVKKDSTVELKKQSISRPGLSKNSKSTIRTGSQAISGGGQNKRIVTRKVDSIMETHEDTLTGQLPVITKKAVPKSFPIPKILTERENSLMKAIQIDENEIQIDYYDNGVIDNDTITVYHNNELVINKGRLSDVPITLKIHLDEKNPTHEIITVAENLGDVPPNTALMVITAGKKRYEVFITSDEKTNAKVILNYKAKQPVRVY